jgi:hypothetical protein
MRFFTNKVCKKKNRGEGMRTLKLFSFCVIVILRVLLPHFASADPLDNWHKRYDVYDVDYDHLNAITYGNGTFVAVGGYYYSIILTSSDGKVWIEQSSGTSSPLNEVAYGNGTFVAVGDHGTILISPDGVTWTPRTAYSGTTNDLYAITYGNGTFVVGGDEHTILTSPDGVTWEVRTLQSFPFYPTDITYGDGIFVAVDGYGWSYGICTSIDGVTWAKNYFSSYNNLNGVSYGNGIFVTVGDFGAVFTSPDGIDWTERNSGTSDDFDGIGYGNGTFVAVGGYYSIILTSPDGIAWTERASGVSYTLYDVAFGNNTFVAVGYDIVQSDPISTIEETISTPNTPTGAMTGIPDTSYSYSSGGSSSNIDHSIEYRFDWGDGTYSDWSASASASKSWSSTSTYLVKAQARCEIHTSIVSAWSESLSVNIFPLTYAISGTVTYNGSGLSDVTMTLSGVSTGSTTTNSSGSYSLTGLSNGTYTVTPSKPGYTFTPTSRTVKINGANQTEINFTAAIACTYTISPTSQSFDSSGGSGSVTVTTQNGCTWSATSNASWITITSGSNGTGNGTVNYTVSSNSTTSQRIGTMTVAGQTFTVTQEKVTAECTTWSDVISTYQQYVNNPCQSP